MSGYTKLFHSILDSTVWLTPHHIRITWVTMLAMADRDGVVQASVPGLAVRARVSREECEEALSHFMSPDPDSRSPEHDGRRIEKVDGGWRLLNHQKYGDLLSHEDRKEKARIRQQRKRDRDNAKRNAESVTSRVTVTDGNACNDTQTQTQTHDGDCVVTRDDATINTHSDPTTLRDLVCSHWTKSYQQNRNGDHPARDDKSAREVVTWLRANAPNLGQSESELLTSVLNAYWQDPWPRDRANRPSLLNLVRQLDGILLKTRGGKPSAPSPDAYDPRRDGDLGHLGGLYLTKHNLLLDVGPKAYDAAASKIRRAS